MQFYLDSASLPLIEASLRVYPLTGVTTNPTILARDIPEGMPLAELLRRIRALTEGKKLFVQVTGDTPDAMLRDAEAIINALGGDLTIKIPCTGPGFEAMKRLSDAGVSVCATACYSTSQALMAAAAGADFVAPYVSHIDNLSQDGAQVSGEMARLLALHGCRTQVLAASFRTAAQVERCLADGVTAVTVTAEMLDRLIAHPGTTAEVESFVGNWAKRFDRPVGELL